MCSSVAQATCTCAPECTRSSAWRSTLAGSRYRAQCGCRVDGRYATLTSIAVCTSTHSTHKAYKMVWTPSARATTSHLQRRRGLLRRRRGWSMRISKMDTWTSWVRRAETGKAVHQVNTLTAGCAVSSALHEHGQSGTAKAARARIRAGGRKMERIVGWYTRDGDWTGVRVGM